VKRSEAVEVLRDIFAAIGESLIMNSVSLDSNDSILLKGSDRYEIKIRCTLDKESKNSIRRVLEKHKLEMKEDRDFLILHSKV
jgi:hypothetical protein